MSAQTVASTASPQGWVPSDETFAMRLSMVRQRMGWTNVKEAAFACGIPTESWRDWETRGRLPRDLVAATTKIADATRGEGGAGVDWDWLMRGTVRPRPGPDGGCTVRDSNPEPADSRKTPGRALSLVVDDPWWTNPGKIAHMGDTQGHPSGSICHIPATRPA